ncbi:MAG: LysR family transcriptional regulator [Clostridia bacterium]|nr:LysR family transcriptional regulator [Clostridia bacterium]
MKEQNYVYAVYEEKSFSKAAKKLFVSQPALSMTVKKTEEELGITIFDRSTSPLTLTEEGEIYIRALEEIRSVERSMRERLSDMTNLKSGVVKVSGENFVSSFIMPPVLMRFAEKYRGIEVELSESNSPDLRQQLLTESIDLLIAHDFDPSLYTAVRLFEEQVLLAVPEKFPIVRELGKYAFKGEDILEGKHKKKNAPVSDLSRFREESFLLLKPGNDMHRRGFSLCTEAGFTPKVGIWLDQLITSYNLARAGLGVAFVTDVLVRTARGDGCVYFLLSGEGAKRQMSIGYKKNRYVSRAAFAFLQTAREVYQKND